MPDMAESTWLLPADSSLCSPTTDTVYGCRLTDTGELTPVTTTSSSIRTESASSADKTVGADTAHTTIAAAQANLFVNINDFILQGA